jgi:hypothetical protein
VINDKNPNPSVAKMIRKYPSIIKFFLPNLPRIPPMIGEETK